jgi:hypothetical protein
MVATFSDPNSVCATAQPGTTAATYDVSVTQLAAVQQNIGTSLGGSGRKYSTVV